MAKHEKHCTMNPSRECRMCRQIDEQEQRQMYELIAVLPNPTIYRVEDGLGLICYEGLEEAANSALPKLRKLAADCPMCVFAAIRQKGIPVPCVTDFNFKGEVSTKMGRNYE